MLRITLCPMFGFSRDKRVEIIPFAQERPHLFTELLCDGCIVRNVKSFDQFVQLLRDLQREHDDCRILASLDDLGQAAYTSGHTIDTHDLDRVEGCDDVATFAVRHANLVAQIGAVQFDRLTHILDWAQPGEDNDVITINVAPDSALGLAREKEFIVQHVPVVRASDALAAFPNGYFQGDLSPTQNYVLARHLEDRHGLHLFAVGSRFLGFWRDAPLTRADAGAVAQDIASIYSDVPDNAVDRLVDLLIDRDTLLVRYTES